MNSLSKYFKGDKVIWVIVIILSLFSLLSVYSSTATLVYKQQGGNTVYYLVKHFIFLAVGIGFIYMFHNVKYTLFAPISKIAIFVAVPLLFLTLFLGSNINEASRWLRIPGTGLTFQTSDFAKLALMMYLARVLSKYQDKDLDFKETTLKIMLPVVLVCVLILPANFSTCALLFATSMILMFIGRVKIKYMLSYMGLGVLGIGLIVLIGYTAPQVFPRFGTWVKRIENFNKQDSDENFQADQAKIAIATGGILGKGPGKSTQRNFLPHPYSDFIFAFIIEEYGLFAGILIIFLYVILLFRGVRIATRSNKTFGGLLAVGCSFILVFQALINMAVATNLFPVTGQPLPLVSMGGTSVFFTCMTIGVILSISRDIDAEEGGELAQA